MGMTDLSEGFPDARLAPKEALARGYQRALRRHGDALLGRGEPRGNLALREQLAEHLRAHRGLSIGPENVLVTRGMAMARTLIATGLLSKGAQVAVEDPGQPEAWEAFRSAAGAVLHPIPVDAGGLDVDALGRLASRQSLDALLVSPRRQDPTTIPLEPERRAQLLDLARQHGFAVLEEDPNAEIFYSEGPALPLAAMDGGGSVLHMGSLAATLAPGLGLGFIVAPRALVDRLARARQRLDDQGDRVLEWALADLLRDGDYSRHLARVRQVYAQRLSDLLEALPVELGAGFQARRPEGGLACWLESPGVDIEAWCRRAQAAGVRILPGSRHALMPRPIEALRLGFGALEPGEMRRALRVLREALPKGAPR
jgi:GntR family transcriptional regulator/MocR family aminotransferase